MRSEYTEDGRARTVFHGFYSGLVDDDQDDQMRGRLRLKIPFVLGDVQSNWALPMGLHSGQDEGRFDTPKIGSMVWCTFENGDPNLPIWIHGPAPAFSGSASPTQSGNDAPSGDSGNLGDLPSIPGLPGITIPPPLDQLPIPGNLPPPIVQEVINAIEGIPTLPTSFNDLLAAAKSLFPGASSPSFIPDEAKTSYINVKVIHKSRKGHVILADDTDGKEAIIIRSGDGTVSVLLDQANDMLVLSCDNVICNSINTQLGGEDADDPLARMSDVEILREFINTHKHSGVQTGSGISGVPSTTCDEPDYSEVAFST